MCRGRCGGPRACRGVLDLAGTRRGNCSSTLVTGEVVTQLCHNGAINGEERG